MPPTVTFKGTPLRLAGRAVKENQPAPDFQVVSSDLKDVGLDDFKGKLKVISVFPSLDTPVCDLQVKEFNKRAAAFSPDVVVIGISKDLPFAQRRFCDTHDIKNEVVLSDYKSGSFGINYGMLIRELNLLARGVIIIDKGDIVRYVEIVPEVTSAVNFDEASKRLQSVVKAPVSAGDPVSPARCKPCEGGAPALLEGKAAALRAARRGWQAVEGKKIVKEFVFRDFPEAKYFTDVIAVIAEEQGHHPVMTLSYNKLKVTLTTHAAGGLTENDFIMAGIIDSLEI